MPTDLDLPRRLSWMAALAAAAFAGLAGRAVHVQLAQGAEHGARLDAGKVERVALPAPRGTVRDARGHVVAEDRPAVDAYVRPATVVPHRSSDLIDPLVAALGLGVGDRQRIEQRVTSVPEARRAQWVLVKRDVPPAVVEAIRADRGLAWIRLVERPGRRYPFGAVAAHAVGYLNEVSPDEVTGAYRAGDRIGRTGVERAFEKTLRGTPGHAFRPASPHVSVPPGFEGAPPVVGTDVTLTLDLELSRAVDAAFERRHVHTGAAVVLDVHRGELRALVSRPSFDPNLVDHGVAIAEQGGASEIDRALMAPEIPGSTFEPFTALAVLRAGAPDPVTCSGAVPFGELTFRCARVHGRVDLHHALAEGCNVWFFHHVAERAGLDAIAAEAQSFGLGVPTGIALGREASGFVPNQSWYDPPAPYAFGAGYALNAAIGQGDVRVTPLQVAVAYAALANGGTVLEPRVVSGPGPTVRRTLEVPEAHLAEVRAALRAGPMRPAAAGIIGRARPGHREEAADIWFAGFALPEAPEVAVVIHAKGASRADLAAIAADILLAVSEGARR